LQCTKSRQLPLNNCLEFRGKLFKILLIAQTLGADTAKRQILSRANLIIIAVSTRKVFTASGAALKKNHFATQNGADGFHDFFDVVVALYGESALVTVIIQPHVHQRDKFFSLQPRKFESLAV